MKSEKTTPGDEGIDESPSLASSQVLHRRVRNDPSLDYFVYAPANASRDSPVLVAVHGIGRNANEVARILAPVAERDGVILVAPRFGADRFSNYQRLGRSVHSGVRGKRSDAALDDILEEVGSLSGASTARINLFGYAAGARFAMRYAMARPERVARAALVSPGSYTFPDPKKKFPQGIGRSSRRPDLSFDPDGFLRIPMTLFEEVREGRGERPRRVEEVGKGAPAVKRKTGKTWVDAMTAAAEAHQLSPQVSFRRVDGTPRSFKAFSSRSGSVDEVFAFLFGPAPAFGPPPAAPAQGSVDGTPGSTEGAEAAEPDLESTGDEPAAPQTFWGRLRKHALPIILGIAAVAILAPIVLWVQYRSTHVVSREAVVRGHIADVGVRLDGVVRSIAVDAGDRVTAGQVVARLEDRHFEARVRRAHSQLEKASRELEVERLAIVTERRRLDSSLNEVAAGLSAAQAERRASQSRADEASRRLDVQKSLATKGLVPEEQVRTAETELRTARAMTAASHADQKAARATQQLAEVESEGLVVREKRLSVLESEVSSYRAELAVAEADLEGAIIRAPEDGAVVRRVVEPGASIVVGQPIISLWLGEETWVEAWIDEDDLADLAVGAEAMVALKSYPDQEFTGVVETIGVSTDIELPDEDVPQPRHERMRDAPVISVRIRLDDPQAELFPGLSAVVGIRKQAN